MIFQSLKPVIKRDSDSFRQLIFSNLRSRSPLIVFIQIAYDSSPVWIRTLLIMSYGLKEYFSAPAVSPGKLACLYNYRNEKKRFEYLEQAFDPGALSLHQVRFSPFVPGKFSGLLGSLFLTIRFYRFLSYIAGKYSFLLSCRISSTLFFYSWFSSEFRRHKPSAVVLSSEANPYAISATWAARKYHVPSIYIPHGQVSPNPPKLMFDLSLLDGEALKKTFEDFAPISGKVIYKGADGEFFPLRFEGLHEKMRVGVFLSIIYDVSDLEKIIRDISRILRPDQILLRLHPNESVAHGAIVEKVRDLCEVKISRNNELSKDIADCDLIVCGNSGTHLECLRQGVPTVQVSGLDLLPHDTRKFIQHAIVPFYTNVGDINLPDLKKFYSEDWPQRMRYFDHYYGVSREAVMSELRTRISEWLNHQGH